MPILVIGAGLIGSQVARILVERGDKPVLMDPGAQVQAIGQIVDLAKVTLIAGDVLRPLSIIDALRTHAIDKIVHTAANPLLTLGAQKDPYAAINLNIMGTVNVLEAARVTGVRRVVFSITTWKAARMTANSARRRRFRVRPRSMRRPNSRWKVWASTTRAGAASSLPACATVLRSDPGAAPAAEARPTSCARRCAMHWRAKRR